MTLKVEEIGGGFMNGESPVVERALAAKLLKDRQSVTSASFRASGSSVPWHLCAG